MRTCVCSLQVEIDVFWFLIFGFWSLVFGFWFLVFGLGSGVPEVQRFGQVPVSYNKI